MSYWLAHGKSVAVMGYTLAVTVWRIATLLAATYWLHDVQLIFVTIVCAEALKNLWIYVWLRRRGLLVFRWDAAAMREQIRLVAPLGAGSVLYKLNDFGKVVVANQMGPVPLALYTTAAYQVPLVNIVQGALADAIFPDMVKRSKRDPAQGLLLWKRAQVLIFAIICPAWLLLTYWAEPFVRLLFTETYVAATPYFQVFLLLMVRQCFQFSTPLAQRRGQRFVRARQSHRARDQRHAHRHADAEVRTVGSRRSGSWSGRPGRLSIWDRACSSATTCRCPNCASGASSRSRWRHRWSRSPQCTPRSYTCRTTAAGIAGVARRVRAGVCGRGAHHPARGIRLRDARNPAPENRMSERPTLLIVSYHFAPSPLVGAKRFSFLTREFTRLGFDVHVITNGINESPHGTRRRLAAGQRHRASRRRAVRSAAQGRRHSFTASPMR